MDVFIWIVIAAVGYWYFKKRYNQDADLLTLMRNDPAAIDRYSRDLGKFKNVTMEWVISNVSPLKELSKDITLQLSTYMVEASTSACKYAGVDDRLQDSINTKLLTQMGLSTDVAVGMLAAISTPASQIGNDLTYGQGESAFSAWIRDGDSAAEDHIREAIAIWQSASNIADEIAAYDRPSDKATNAEPHVSDIVDLGDKIADALSIQTVLFSLAGVMPDKAKDNWSIGYVIGFTNAMLESNGSIEESSWGRVQISVLLSLFGEEQGSLCIDRYYEGFTAGDEVMFDGVKVGEEDIADWLNKGTSKNCTPIRWSAYVHGQSIESEDTSEEPFQEYRAQYLEEVKRLDPEAVSNDMHWLELTDDEATRKAFTDGKDPKQFAKFILENVKITDVGS